MKSKLQHCGQSSHLCLTRQSCILQLLRRRTRVGFLQSLHTRRIACMLHMAPLFSKGDSLCVLSSLCGLCNGPGSMFGRVYSAEGAKIPPPPPPFFISVATGFFPCSHRGVCVPVPVCVCVLHITKCHAGRSQTLKELGGGGLKRGKRIRGFFCWIRRVF